MKQVVTVTIPEGYSRAQIAPLVDAKTASAATTRRRRCSSKYLNPADYGGKDAKNLEGFLFPATYELKPRRAASPTSSSCSSQDFKRRIKGVDMSYAKSKNLTVYDVLTIASMIERRGAGRQGAAAGRRGDLQPPARRDAAGDRRDDPLRHRQLRPSR